jgi:alanine dehydrogenase
MNICVPKEKQYFEFRVGLHPAGVKTLVQQGHTCYIEHNAGLEAGFADQDFLEAGGKIVYSSEEVFGRSDLLLKIAKPTVQEIQWLRHDTVVAGLLHLSCAREEVIRSLEEKQVSTLSYERIQLPDKSFPVRKPLSQIGGRLSAQIGASLMQNNSGGRGIILGGIAGIPQAKVVVIGAGIVGSFATYGFVGMGAHVTVLDSNLNALQAIQEFSPVISTLVSTPNNIAYACHGELLKISEAPQE